MSVQQSTAVDVFRNRVRESGAQVGFRQRTDQGWKDITWNELSGLVDDTAAALLALGLQKGDRCAIVADGCYEAVAVDLATLHTAGISVPIYGSHTRAGIEYVLTDSKPRVLFLEDPLQLRKLLVPESRAKLKAIEQIVLLRDRVALAQPDEQGRRVITLADQDVSGLPIVTWADLCKRGRAWAEANAGSVAARAAQIAPADPFRIVYTSGTTGTSKGAVLSHRNIVAECTLMSRVVAIKPDDEQLFIVPLARVLGMALQWYAIQIGCRTAFGTPQTVREDLLHIKPTFIGQGPFFYQAFFNEAAAEAERGGAEAKAQFEWALGVGQRYSDALMANRQLPADVQQDFDRAKKILFDKITERFGGRLRFTLSGGLPLSRELSTFMHSAGVVIYEGYGMSEMTSFTHVNRPGACRFGSSGQILPTLEQKLADDGELLVRGDVVMTGYFEKASATEAAFEPDGFFHTGDVGRFDNDGYFYFVDRKENLIHLASGKIVPPQQLEVPLKTNDIFSQVIVFGEGRPHLVALVTLSEKNLFAWARERGIAVTTYSEMTKLPAVRQFVQQLFDKQNQTVEPDFQIRAFAILPQDLRSETGELTQTMKPRRKFLAQIHRSAIESLYAS
jgi:long-chain acyl-CoA synthetase